MGINCDGHRGPQPVFGYIKEMTIKIAQFDDPLSAFFTVIEDFV